MRATTRASAQKVLWVVMLFILAYNYSRLKTIEEDAINKSIHTPVTERATWIYDI